VTAFVKHYKKQLAVDGVDLEVRQGEIYGLIGPDGSGKSSLMKAIAGVLTYDEGMVEVFGTLVDSERAAERVKE
jgi:ABC-2 type transport system ATP-binding protein